MTKYRVSSQFPIHPGNVLIVRDGDGRPVETIEEIREGAKIGEHHKEWKVQHMIQVLE